MLRPSLAPCSSIRIKYLREFIFLVLANCGKSENNDKEQRNKLLNILNHDVQRIERLITDYSQMLKDEVALSKEKMKKIDLHKIVKSVVEDFNSIYEAKRGIKVEFIDENNSENYY